MTVDHELFGDRLPSFLTRFVGRRSELAELRDRCYGASVITLCGVGGLGKTRLAIELARSLRDDPPSVPPFDETYWVPLVVLSDPDDVGAAIAGGLGLTGASGPRALLAVVNALRGRRTLLVVDNCEQVVAGCVEAVSTLRSEGIDVVVIATSRVPLGISEELLYTVPPMTDDALELFGDRARNVATNYAVTELNSEPIRQICARLGGLPLAVELAATWTRALSPVDLLAQLTEVSRPASRSAAVEERHTDLDLVLAGTWDWLSERDREVATALGVFAGGFTRDAAEQVTGADLASLATLTERGIMQRIPDPSGGTRYQLHELVRQYAVDRLRGAGPHVVATVRDRHFDYFVRVAEGIEDPSRMQLEPRLGSPVATERANLDAALRWVLDRGDSERALRIVDALCFLYPYSEPRRRDRLAQLTRLFDLSGTQTLSSVARGKALVRLAHSVLEDDPLRSMELFRAAHDTFVEVGDQVGEGVALRNLSWAAYAAGDLSAAARHNRASLELSRRIDDQVGEAWSENHEGIFASMAGDTDRALKSYALAGAIFRRHRAPFGQYRVAFQLAECLRRARRWRPALAAYRSAFDLAETERFTSEGGDLLEGLGCVAAALKDGPAAARLAGAAEMWRAVYDERSRIFWPSGTADIDRARRDLGEDTWRQLVAEGHRLTTRRAELLAYEVMEQLAAALDRAEADLTDREIDVLRLVAEGLSNTAIAERLVLSPRTVHAHLRSVFTKLDVPTRTAAAHEAVRRHLV